MNQKKKAKRFVLFLDILGFKDMVNRYTHNQILKKLEKITNVLGEIQKEWKELKIEKSQTKPITFSDSIIIFSQGASENDALKILMDAHYIQLECFRNQIPIKGAISFGDITVDFDKSLFFGQPIIDAFLLHEDLQLLSVIVDHNAEKMFDSLKEKIPVYQNLSDYLTPMKFGRVLHKLLRLSDATMTEGIKNLNKMYYTTSGKPRVYIDNTLNFYKSFENSTRRK